MARAKGSGVFLLIAILLTIYLTSPAWCDEVVFPGGSLDDLKALSPTLEFDRLVMTGKLNLEPLTPVILRVNELEITASGGVGYSQGLCDYFDAPDFTVIATGSVVISGDIVLTGKYGTRITPSATCNQCTGQDGGEVTVTAGSIVLSAEVRNRGGAGSTMRSSYGSSGCSGGNAGHTRLEADDITFYGGALSTQNGDGGTGYISGKPSHGADGAPGNIGIITSNLFKMSQSSASCDGVMTLTAGQTDIYGPLTYGQLVDDIGGSPDNLDPEGSILSPVAGGTVIYGEPLTVKVGARDGGVGIREVEISGLGYSQIHGGNEFINGVLSVRIASPAVPPSLDVRIRDNKNREIQDTVDNLKSQGDIIVNQGITWALDSDLDIGDSDIVVKGILNLKRNGDRLIKAASLEISDTGIIGLEAPGDQLAEKAPSLTMHLTQAAMIKGKVDLSGGNGLGTIPYNSGQDGGDFSLTAVNITMTGQVITNGGNARFVTSDVRAVTGGDGGQAGDITLTAHNRVLAGGSFSAEGGDASTGDNCFRAGDGGDLTLKYRKNIDISGITVSSAAGYPGPTGAACKPTSGYPGGIYYVYYGPVNPSELKNMSETEPNGPLDKAHLVWPAGLVKGEISLSEDGDLIVTYVDNTTDVIEDLYLVELGGAITLTLELTPVDNQGNLDLIVINKDPLSLITNSSNTTGGQAELIQDLELAAGSYILGVTERDTAQADSRALQAVRSDGPTLKSTRKKRSAADAVANDYELAIVPVPGPDTDKDGLSDWWEIANFGNLDRDGSGDWDNDGLTDKEEYNLNTTPLGEDTDGDGMPDKWEVDNGLDPLENDADDDPDEDGYSNWTEYKAGTDPNNKTSHPVTPKNGTGFFNLLLLN